MSVSVLTTGGTIASLPSPDGDVRVAVHGAELVPGQAVRVHEVMLAHSFNLTRADVLRLARRILAELEDPAVEGVVVTHGTDTMEETAYLLDLVLPPASTVVLTGAQRHASAPDADGPRNLADALRVAADPRARGMGAVITMGGQIHAARYATKAHTLALEAFASPGQGPVGLVRGTHVDVRRPPARPDGFRLAELGDLEARVDIVPVFLDADGVQIAACRAAGARGLVVQALGTGNPTPGVLRELETCLREGIAVLVTSRCAQGPATPVYGAGGGADLAKAGAVFAGSLNAPKARLLLMAALAAEPHPAKALDRLRPHLGQYL
ncbi:asparaginase [Actinomadura welshii]|uniref:asparaginase n=1 Tax=Actinomadura welshii TaxID=3103817 RepID=UPI0003ACEB72|nr:asparaginase [Actinomadura madurae]